MSGQTPRCGIASTATQATPSLHMHLDMGPVFGLVPIMYLERAIHKFMRVERGLFVLHSSHHLYLSGWRASKLVAVEWLKSHHHIVPRTLT